VFSASGGVAPLTILVDRLLAAWSMDARKPFSSIGLVLDNTSGFDSIVCMDVMSAAEAAKRLDVNRSRVHQLIELGRLPAQKVGNQWIVDSDGVERLRKQDRQPGRPYAARNAWALLALAAGREPAWISTAERKRLRRILDSHQLEDLIPRLSRRAKVAGWYVHPSLLDSLLEDARTVVGGASAVESLIDEGLIEIYVPASAVSQISSDYYVEEDADRPNVVRRAVDGPWPFEVGQRIADGVVAAVDLLELDDDPRRVRVAKELLAHA